MSGKEKIEKTIDKSKKILEESIDKGIDIGIKVKEYLVDDTLNDVDKILSIKKKKEGDEEDDI